MEVVTIGENGVLEKVISVLRRGEVVAVPTDTVYGLIADATNNRAVRRIYEIKGREESKPLPIFVSDIEQARTYADLTRNDAEFLKKVWPGAVTVVLGLREFFKDTIGMRVPKDEFLQNVIREMDKPLAQSSANISGAPPARTAREVQECFRTIKYSPVCLVDGGERGGEASTVIDLTCGTPRILREGAVSRERLRDLLRSSGFSGLGTL